MSLRRRVVGYVTYATYRLMHAVCPMLPTRSGRRLFQAAGRLLYRVAPRMRATVAANQAQVLGRPIDDALVQASTREAFAGYARYWFDTFHVLSWSDEEVLEAFPFEGLDLVEKALAEGKGVLIALPHMGNWDVAGKAMAIRLTTVVSVAEHLEPEPLFELFLRHRNELGMEIVDLGSEHVGRQLTQQLERNRIVALVADRDLSGGGTEVEMFGRTRRMPAGPALLSLSAGAPLLATSIVTTPTGWELRFRTVTAPRTGRRKEDVVALTRALAAEFERGIAESPSDWHLFQPGWDRDVP
ncbi:MAG TPA: phosphatidylinositol mannoside acyltransferase [Actinomycetota bacterium]